MDKVFASIITIGDELLIGQVIDTNSAWMAQQLNEAGIFVQERLSVGDVWYDMWKALDACASRSPIVLITGGLGPTADDITKPLLCEYFGGRLVMNESVLEHLENIFRKLNRPMIDRNRKQAEVPDVCTVLFNERGTAPGMWFEKDGVIFVSMPGVPHEMKGIMTKEVLPRLQQRMKLPAIVHRTLLTAGIGESFLADAIQQWEEALPGNIKLAYLPNYGMVRLRLTGHGDKKERLIDLLLNCHRLRSGFTHFPNLLSKGLGPGSQYLSVFACKPSCEGGSSSSLVIKTHKLPVYLLNRLYMACPIPAPLRLGYSSVTIIIPGNKVYAVQEARILQSKALNLFACALVSNPAFN